MNALTPFPDAVPLAAASSPPEPREDASRPHGAAIAFSGITKRFAAKGAAAEVVALDDVTLDVAPGSITGIIGRSGAGKSTLLRTINGLDRPTAGTVRIDGIDVGALDGADLRSLRREIGMIFQHFALLSSRTVFDNIALPLELAGTPRDEITRRVDELIELVGLTDKRGRYPAELSGGQKQRVGIARALATRPRVLLSDEATSALDPETTHSILALLKRINALTGVTIVLITHEMQVIKEICDRVAVIEAGRIIEAGDVYEVFARPQAETTRNFVASVTGAALPEAIAAQLRPDPEGASQTVLRIVFTGENATAPVISRLSRSLDVDVTVLAGQVDAIAGKPFGNLIVAIPARPDVVDAVVALAGAHGLQAEVLGHVA
ncbi:methionine ABC transporter ATP-binding protein [Phreatobacter oligotrophus]|uniref:methionine ABC transporter ATP-binding protein n=1 Tax=Phreatobacter oligotrophus TaxID=1122261 RepID=UPI002354C23D|nr:methionine ABC transporter ATP-binding protein [Phreatobacter oligotrophus]MBX9991409.1 methionine ABC transporter ATP-binding protein [Phreatobacter oligotrophus]